MNRPRVLSEGWYPTSASAVVRQCEEWKRDTVGAADSWACVAPHAGWYFSGKLAFAAVSRLRADAQTVVIIGGHLPAGAGVLAALEETYETPLGPVESDATLLAALRARVALRDDESSDNSVEIQLPIVHYRFPRSKALWLRTAPSDEASRLGAALYDAAREVGRAVVLVGSTDLTHYGPAYRFTPHGEGSEAVRWTEEESDGRIIEALIEMSAKKSLAIASSEHSACSIGGAVAALTFAARCGARRGELIGHYTSYDVQPSDSFVGYGAIAYAR